MNVLAVIPARGGSKGIPRKNLRPLAGKPLMSYAIQACLDSRRISLLVVTTDDEEIALLGERLGAEIVRRPSELADDRTTLDPVIVHATAAAESQWNTRYDVVLTVQPTSPLLRGTDIDEALQRFEDDAIDTVLSVTDDRHLCWGIAGGIPVPRYSERVNRQWLPANFRETGSIIACRREQLERGTRIGRRVELLVVHHERSVDIDSLSDLYHCESILSRRRIVFTVVGRAQLGMGHVYRALTLAHELVHHDLVFVCEDADDLAIAAIRRHHYRLEIAANGKLLETVVALSPDLVVNDILDTSVSYIDLLKQQGARVVNFEDMGSGAEHANLVINALYPHQLPESNVLVGAKYFCLRDEFLHIQPRTRPHRAERLLVTFGGTDPNNLTCRVLEQLAGVIGELGLEVDVVVGPGYAHGDQLEQTLNKHHRLALRLIDTTCRISEFMQSADLAITSGGRTVYELAALHVPTIVLCQNSRELTHSFASADHGIANLGLGTETDTATLAEIFRRIAADGAMRDHMVKCMARVDLRKGKQRVISHLLRLLNQAPA